MVHTGVPSIEAAIRQYVQKYAKTAKIKNIVDTFIHKLDAVGCFEETKRELAENQDKSEKIVKEINNIRKNMGDIHAAKDFENAVDDAVIKIDDNSKEMVNRIIKKFQSEIKKKIDGRKNEELNIDDAKYEIERLKKFAKKLEPDFQAELEEMIGQELISIGKSLLEEYKKKLGALTKNINVSEDSEKQVIDPIRLMGGSIISADSFGVEKFIQTKKVENGEEWVKNTDKKWYKPWTWFQENGYYRTKYKTVEYVKGDELAQAFFQPVEDNLYENGENARRQALERAKRISEIFNQEFKKLDKLLEENLAELEDYATDKEKAEERIQESKRKLKWLEEIQKNVEAILEI